jgi:hypothetical protein
MAAFEFHRTEIDRFAAELSEEDRRAILRESVAFEATGRIGEDAVLRRAGAAVTGPASLSNMTVVMMTQVINAVHRHYSMQVMEKVLSDPEPWRPGEPADPGTHVRGADFRRFYEEGWDPNWYHDDSDVAVEDETGAWILPDDVIVRLDQLGCAVWQGPEKGADWRGNIRRSGEFVGVHELFDRWAKGWRREARPEDDAPAP